MKRFILLVLITLSTSHTSWCQEWMTSLDAAKRIAMVQDKLLFMIWEDASKIPYPVEVNTTTGAVGTFEDMFNQDEINRILWQYFVPVKVSEDLYGTLYGQIKDTRNGSYRNQFKDDNIKIMDINYNIVNVSNSPEAYFNLSEFITIYGLNTNFLKSELSNYSEQKDFNTTYRLASKYMDYAILVNPKVRPDIINLALVYLDEADVFLVQSKSPDKLTFETKTRLLRLSQYLLKDRPGKVLRQLKKIDMDDLEESNEALITFLYYTAYKLKRDKKNIELWKSKVSLVNLKKAQLITNLHI